MASNELLSKFHEKIGIYYKIFKSRPIAKSKTVKPKEIESKLSLKKQFHSKLIPDAIHKNVIKPKKLPELIIQTKKHSQSGIALPVISESNQQQKENVLITKNKEEESYKPKLPIILKQKPKSFLVLGGYPDLIKALTQRGWHQLTDPKSKAFDYIFTLKSCDIHHNELQPNQMAGHFWKNGELTRKIGLATNIRCLFFKGIDVDCFFPRCYELSEKADFEDFIEDFKTTKTIGLLKQFANGHMMKEIQIKCAIDIIQRKLPLLINEVKEDETRERHKGIKAITDAEWKVIGDEDNEVFKYYLEKMSKQKMLGFTIDQDNRSKSVNPKITKRLKSRSDKIDNEDNIKVINTKEKDKMQNGDQSIVKYFPIVCSILKKFEDKVPNNKMNGDKNIWIIKPSGLSRGRGIECINKLCDILHILKSSNQFIIQKYIENPLIILGRKFDIRQWVLVTDLVPLTVWLFDKPYLRFGAEDYSIEDIHNRFSHLTNNSVAKNSEQFLTTKIEGNMWENESFRRFLLEKYGRDVWPEIQEKIRKIVLCSLQAVKHKICQRKNTHEIFGYDIMVDDELNCFLIEVNSSPAMDYSTQVTKKLVKIVLEDLVKVVVDYENTLIKDRGTVDTGMFKLVFKGNEVPSSCIPNMKKRTDPNTKLIDV